ncbi:MAG: hypothetical protein JW768_13765 [Chitinispirillaceae bacterium]|nr:hypothetical protein [Chitinispirillaceae bacterium]
MELPDTFKTAINNYLTAPDSKQNISRIDSAYWAFIADTLAECVRYKKDLHTAIEGMRDFIDFGICPEMVEEHDKVIYRITTAPVPFTLLKINLFSSFIKTHLSALLQEGSRERIEKEIAIAERERSRLEREMVNQQKSRKQLLFSEFNGSPKLETIAEQMEIVDTLLGSSLELKKNVGRGSFIPADQKREHFARETNLSGMQAKISRFLSSVPALKESAAQINQHSGDIVQILEKIIDINRAITKMRDDIDRIEQEQRSISGLELENRIRIELDYLRDLVRLSARRLRITSCPLLRPDDTYFTLEKLAECLERILEFDPRVFQNERTPHFGKPSVLLVPGNGNALYDWKNNQIIVPLVPYNKNFMASVASGIIEYRFDVDEDKKLLHSYNQLPEHRNIKSLLQLKSKLVKDYTIWMTSEYDGFRILSAPVKKWFEREIAPNRNEIYTPFQYQSFELPSAAFQSLFSVIEPAIENPQRAATEDLWIGSILLYQLGKFDKSFSLLIEVKKRNPDTSFIFYNLGHTAMKAMRKNEAIEAFSDFIRRHAQSWWTSVAHDYLRQLQAM